MARLKDATDKIAGKTREAVAEIIGDGKLREEGKAQQRKAEGQTEQPDGATPLDPLKKLT